MRLWGFILVLILASIAGVMMSRDPGYTLFSYGNTTIEMPLWLSILLIAATIIILTLSLLLLTSLFTSAPKLRYWWFKHRKETARLQTYRGLLELAEGHWQKAEKYLIKSALLSDTPLINYLAAAEAAEESGSIERRDTYLQLAHEASTHSDIAVRLTEAQLQLKHGEIERSIIILEKLYQEFPKHPKVLRLLSNLYQSQQNWEALLELLPRLKKQKVLSNYEYNVIEEKVYNELLLHYSTTDLKSLMHLWHHAPKTIQINPKLIGTYVWSLYQLSAYEEAETIIEKTLKKSWNDQLIQIYGLIDGKNRKKQLAFAESFLTKHFDNPYLLQCLGKLCLKNQLWGKARDYLEQSLINRPTPETYAELGQLMEQLGMIEKRDEYYKKGILLATENNNTYLGSPRNLIRQAGDKVASDQYLLEKQ